MKKSMDILIWAFLLFLITPSGMALASWNSVPGEKTYAWKLTLERALLLILSPSDKLASTAEVKITERRFSEVEQTLDSEYAVEGLQNLNRQLAATSTNIQKIDKSATRTQANEQYLASLKKMSSTLKEQKTKAKTGQIAAVAQKSTSTATTNNSGTIKPSSNSYNVYNIYNVRPDGATITPRPTVVISNSNNNTVVTPSPTSIQNNDVSNNQVVEVNDQTTEINDTNDEQSDSADVIEAIEETESNVNQTIEILELIQASNLNEDGDTNNLNPNQQQLLENMQENAGNSDQNSNGNNNNGNEINQANNNNDD